MLCHYGWFVGFLGEGCCANQPNPKRYHHSGLAAAFPLCLASRLSFSSLISSVSWTRINETKKNGVFKVLFLVTLTRLISLPSLQYLHRSMISWFVYSSSLSRFACQLKQLTALASIEAASDLYLSLSPSLSLVCLSARLPVCLSLSLCVCVCVCVSVCLSVSLALSRSLSLPLCPWICHISVHRNW